MTKTRTIEVDEDTAATLKERAALQGLSVAELLAEMTALQFASSNLTTEEIAELDRGWGGDTGRRTYIRP